MLCPNANRRVDRRQAVNIRLVALISNMIHSPRKGGALCHLRHELADLKRNVAASAKNLNVRS